MKQRLSVFSPVNLSHYTRYCSFSWRNCSSPGTGYAAVISHDRCFLDRIATHMLAFEGDSHVERLEGNCEDYVKDHKKRVGADAD